MIRIYIAHARQDRAVAERLRELLEERGIEVRLDIDINPGQSYEEEAERVVRDSDWVLVLWSASSSESNYVQVQAQLAHDSGNLLPVSLEGAPPPAFARLNTIDLTAWSGERDHRQIRDLLESVRPRDRPVTLDAEAGDNYVNTRQGTDKPRRRFRSSPGTAAPSPQSRNEDLGIVNRVRDFFQFGTRKKGNGKPSAIDTTQQPRPEASVDADVRQPVWLGASAPRHCSPGQRFTAALVAYIDAARASAREKLEALGEPGDRVVMDVAPQHNASWQVGAPVAVRLTGEGIDVTPGEVRFEWNGRENSAAFAARVHDDAPATVVLGFEVFVADVPIAYIPMRLNIAAQTAPLSVQHAQASVPNSVFASYSSKDAQPVTQRLSTLQRWSPGLDIFQDCLDLQPDKSFQPQLKEQISQRDVFLLFWSRSAAASPWVKWEYETARDTRGLDAILPMPLEDPAIAPPPPELADRPLRDRFMLAGYGLAKIRDEASGSRPA